MKRLPALLAATICSLSLTGKADYEWRLVTDASTLAADDEVIIAALETDVAMKYYASGNNCGQASITKGTNDSNEKICTFAANAGVGEFTLVTGSASGTFSFDNAKGNGTGSYLYAAGGTGKNNYLKAKTAQDGTSSWTITISSTGAATIICADTSVARNRMFYNSTSSLFSCYASGQQDICLYRKTEVVAPNNAPVATGTGSATTSVGVAATVELSTLFTDADGDALTYTADAGTVSGSTLSYTPASTGTTTITVTATDPSGASANTTVTITAVAGNVAPVISVPQNSYTTPVGGSDITFTVTATGSPAPTVTASCTEGAYFLFEGGVFLFEPDTAGTYHFVFTATNSEGSDSATVTVTVKVVVPALTISNVADTTASASWTACDDVSTYTLQLASDDQFSEASPGGENVTLFSNPATSVTAPDGWTYDLSNSSGSYLQLLATDKSVVSPAVSTKGL